MVLDKEFWGSVGRRATEGGEMLLNAVDTGGKPKVTHNHLVPTGEEDIFSLEVAMDDCMVMEIAESRSHLQEYFLGPSLGIFP